jgi:hypothetical protein
MALEVNHLNRCAYLSIESSAYYLRIPSCLNSEASLRVICAANERPHIWWRVSVARCDAADDTMQTTAFYL